MMIAALMVATLTASAQGPFIKPMAGGTLTTFTGTDVDDLKMRFGFVAVRRSLCTHRRCPLHHAGSQSQQRLH